MKVITLTGLKQVDELSRGTKCTPVEDSTMSGDKVIRCKEDIAVLEASAPPKLASLSGMKKRSSKELTAAASRVINKKYPGLKCDSSGRCVSVGALRGKRTRKPRPKNKPCVPEWVAMRTKLGKTVNRCRCGGKLTKSARCGKRG